MRILLTGATGLLGSHLAELLLSKNIEVHALVRKIPRKSFLGSFNGEYPQNLNVIESDLDSYQPADNVYFDAVIHTAAKVSSDESQKDEIWHTNLESTKNLFSNLKGKCKKWVQVSSIATLCDGSDVLVDESFHGHARETHYAQSKLKTDLWLMENHPESLIIHPTYMLGKWDTKPSSGAILFALKFKKIQSFENKNKNFVAASDVAAGILQAIEAGQKGNFILGNQNLPIKEFLTKASRELNMPFELIEETLTSDSQDFVREFCLSSNVSSNKARDAFKYDPKKNVDELLKEVMDFFEEQKMLKRSAITN